MFKASYIQSTKGDASTVCVSMYGLILPMSMKGIGPPLPIFEL